MAVPVPAPGGAAIQQSQFQLSASDIWRVVRSNMWLIIVVFVVSIGVGYATNWYLAKNHSRFTAVGLIEIRPTSGLTLPTEREATIDSGTLVIEQNTQKNLMLQESFLLSALKRDKIRDTSWFKSFTDPEGRFSYTRAKEDLLDNLRIAPIQDTKLVAIQMTWKNPADTKTIVDEIVEQHLYEQKQNAQERWMESSRQLNNLKQKLTFTLRDLSQELRDKAIKLNIDGMGVPGRLSAREVELQGLLTKQFELGGDFSEADGAYRSTVDQVQQGVELPMVQQLVDRDQDVMSYKSQLMGLDMQLQATQSSLGPEHKLTQQLRSQRDFAQQKLDDTLASVRAKETAALVEQLRSRRDATEAALSGYAEKIHSTKQELGDLTYEMSQYLTAKDKEQAINELLTKYTNDLDRIQQMAEKADASGVNWARHPEVPDTPSFPKLWQVMAVAVALGLAISLGIAFTRELMDTSVRTPRDIARVGQLNLLGLVPHEDDDPQVAGAPLPLVIFQAPHSVLAEGFRQLRSRLQHVASLDTMRSILVTSPSPGDGKTTIACNLAAGLALNGRRILLVDANFRRPELHRVFSIANENGFSNALTSLEAFESALCQSQVPNLDVMPSGPRPPNATELIESQLLNDFLERALEEYDHVIFDTGPLLLVSETGALAPRVDGVISVVRARINSRGLLQRLRDSLRQSRAEHVGVVLNGVRAHAGGYYNRNIKTYYAYSNA